jgi:hypothetical protein
MVAGSLQESVNKRGVAENKNGGPGQVQRLVRRRSSIPCRSKKKSGMGLMESAHSERNLVVAAFGRIGRFLGKAWCAYICMRFHGVPEMTWSA